MLSSSNPIIEIMYVNKSSHLADMYWLLADTQILRFDPCAGINRFFKIDICSLLSVQYLLGQ